MGKYVCFFIIKYKIFYWKISLRSCCWIGRMGFFFRIRFCYIYDIYRMFKYFELLNYNVNKEDKIFYVFILIC